MKLLAKAFSSHKESESFLDYQDRIAINNLRVALSDGASESFMQGLWAEILAMSFVDGVDGVDGVDDDAGLLELNECSVGDWIRDAQNHWKKSITELLKKDLPYFTENAIISTRSAGATFLGLEFNILSEGLLPNNTFEKLSYKAIGIGDSVLMKFNNSLTIIPESCFPMAYNSKFTNSPDYVDSFPGRKGRGEFSRQEGYLACGETLIIASDALAEWIINHDKRRSLDINSFWGLNDDIVFEKFVSNARKDEQFPLKDDDTTIIILRLEAGDVDEEKVPQAITPLYISSMDSLTDEGDESPQKTQTRN